MEQSCALAEDLDRQMGPASLEALLRPRSVAVIGASRDPKHIGFRVLDALLDAGFQGSVLPVNPRAATVHGLRAFATVRDIPGPVDLAVIAVPCAAVPLVLDDCIAKGVGGIVVVSAGFAETGAAGADAEQRLLEKVRAAGIRLIGPNCLGLLNTDPAVRLNASFVPIFPPRGRVAMSSDSGALGLVLLEAAGRLGLGVSSCVSVGNRADVSATDLLEFWEQDEATGVVLLYLESFGDPRRFARVVRRVARRKPVVALKAGRTRAGRRAAGSHTAALAASEVGVDALFHQLGVLRADTLQEMFNLATALDHQPLPAGRRVAVVTNAGGPGILCADACEAGGLVLPELPDSIRAELASFLPASASLANPVDLIASATAEQFRRVVSMLLKAEEIDALIALCVCEGGAGLDDVAEAIAAAAEAARAAGAAGKPVLACLMAEQETPAYLAGRKERIPCYRFPEEAACALGKMAAHADWLTRPVGEVPELEMDLASARAVCARALRERGAGWLTTQEVLAVLRALRLPVAAGGVATTADEAARLAREVGFPVAVKVASQRVLHKTEAGGVHLDLADEEAVREAFKDIHDRLRSITPGEPGGMLVQPMVTGGTEVLVGLSQDPLFGPLVGFGLGGVLVEVLGDVCFRATPLTDRDAAEMVRSIKGARLLDGYRGRPPADLPALEDILLRVSRIAEELPEIVEIDLNPVIALPPGQGCRIVDARIRVEAAGKE